MIPMITKEEFEKAVNYCTEFTVSCKGCPLNGKDLVCGVYLTKYIKTSLHCLPTAQARRYQKIPVQYYSLMIAQKSRFVKHMIPQTKPVQI